VQTHAERKDEEALRKTVEHIDTRAPLPEPHKQPDKRTAEELSNDIRRMATGAGVSIEQTAIYTSTQR